VPKSSTRILLLISIASAQGLGAQAASGLRVGLASIAPARVDVTRPLLVLARSSINSSARVVDSTAKRSGKSSNAPLLGAVIGAFVGGVSFRLLADNHVDEPGHYATFGAIVGGGLGLLIGLSWKSMHQ
jgi:hypothetical protein